VEDILAIKKERNALKYQANWVRYNDDLEWYLASNFKYSPYKLRDFYLKHLDLLGPLRKLSEWIEQWEKGVDDYDSLDDDRD
jgi:hypothetical protein